MIIDLDTQEAFLASIFAAPGSDLPKLVYADWLDERGDHATADVFRAAVAANRATGMLTETQEWQAFLASLQVRGWDPAIAKAFFFWEAAKPTIFAQLDHEGFEAVLRAEMIDSRIDCFLAEEATVSRGTLRDSRFFDFLLSSPICRNVSILNLSGNIESIMIEDPPRRDSQPDIDISYYDVLTTEEVLHPAITTPAVEALCRHPFAKRITELNLSNNLLGNDAIRALANSQHFIRLKKLKISQGNSFRGRVWQLLVERYGKDIIE